MSLRRRIRAAWTRLAGSRWSPLATIVGVDTSEPVAALTFDDGPDPRFTRRLFDILEHHGASGTFFMIGQAAEAHPELVGEAAERGHTVANHTYSHPSLPSLSGRERRREIRRCDRALAPHGSALFRPPKGHQTLASRIDARLCGQMAVGWSAEADDWRPHEPAWIARRLENQLGPGAILLLHDGLWDPADARAADRGATLEAVDHLLERYGDSYRFLSLNEMLDGARWVCEYWHYAPRIPDELEDP